MTSLLIPHRIVTYRHPVVLALEVSFKCWAWTYGLRVKVPRLRLEDGPEQHLECTRSRLHCRTIPKAPVDASIGLLGHWWSALPQSCLHKELVHL